MGQRLEFNRPDDQFARAAVGDAIVIGVGEEDIIRPVTVIVPDRSPAAERLKRPIDPAHLVLPINHFAVPPVQDICPRLWLHAEREHVQLLTAGETADGEIMWSLAVLAAGVLCGKTNLQSSLSSGPRACTYRSRPGIVRPAVSSAGRPSPSRSHTTGTSVESANRNGVSLAD